MKPLKSILIVCLTLSCTTSCVIGFSNSNKHIPTEFKSLYFPSAIDSSIYGGNSSRLSTAVRQKLLKRSDLKLESLNQARWALQIKILDREQSIVAVDSCKNPTTPSVANGSFACSAITPKFDPTKSDQPYPFNKPYISPSTEKLSLVVESKAIDLKNGKTILAKRYVASSSNIPPSIFNEIGDTDGNTIKYMQQTPDLHGLKNQEAIEKAVEAFSVAIANDVLDMIFKAFSNADKNEI